MPVFALFDVGQERVAAFLMYVLSIVGGAVAGYILAILLGRLFDRAVLGPGKQSADVLHKIFRALMAIGIAILVAILFFPGGGGGKGTGEGNQEGPDRAGNNLTGSGSPDPKTPPAATPPMASPGTTLEPDEAARAVIRLEILGGADLRAKTDFYREVGQERQLTLEGEANSVEKLVATRREKLKPGVGVTILYRLTPDANSPDYQGLTTLKAWGTKNGVGVESIGR